MLVYSLVSFEVIEPISVSLKRALFSRLRCSSYTRAGSALTPFVNSRRLILIGNGVGILRAASLYTVIPPTNFQKFRTLAGQLRVGIFDSFLGRVKLHNVLVPVSGLFRVDVGPKKRSRQSTR